MLMQLQLLLLLLLLLQLLHNWRLKSRGASSSRNYRIDVTHR
jgi:hypothetical protein